MRSNIIIVGGLLLFGAIVLATWKPIPLSKNVQAVVEQGVVTDIYQAGIEDLVLKINGTAKSYYLDEGLTHGFNLAELKNKLMNKTVLIRYDKSAGFNTENSTHYISQLQFEDEIILSDND
jgi:hypothetical protein